MSLRQLIYAIIGLCILCGGAEQDAKTNDAPKQMAHDHGCRFDPLSPASRASRDGSMLTV